jgi:branched-chain amino acid transport system permease protein
MLLKETRIKIEHRFQKNILMARDGIIGLGRWIILAVVLVVIPFFSSNYVLTLINNALISSIAITGLNLISGYTGVISLGNAAFLGIGAFSAGILVTQFSIPWWLSIVLGALLAMLVGLIIGIPALRLKGIYLLMATIALHFITEFSLHKYTLWTKKLSGIRFPKVEVGGFVFDSQEKFYYLLLAIAALVIFFLYNLFRTALGRSLMATRDNEAAAKAMGVNIVYAKLMAFAVSSFIIGIAGGLQGIYVRNVIDEMYGFSVTFDQLCALFIGGIGTLFGPVYGAVFITFLPDFIGMIINFAKQALPFMVGSLEKYHFEIIYFIYGLCIVLVLMFKPTGLAGMFSGFYKFIDNLLKKRF